jgi:hypothetical protein
MDLINYDFESKLEQGFKALFNTNGINLYIADDIDGDLPDENVRLDLSVGGVISNEHLKDSTIYDNYSGALEIEIQTPRVSDDQVAPETRFAGDDSYIVSGAGTTEANGLYVRNGDSPNSLPAYTLYDSDRITVLYNIWSDGGPLIGWYITSTAIGNGGDVLYSQFTSQQGVPESGWARVGNGVSPAPTVTRYTAHQFTSRHAELVAIARKAIEEIDAAVLLANWSGALSPTKIKPTGTERDNDIEHRVTKLSYDLQFRIT